MYTVLWEEAEELKIDISRGQIRLRILVYSNNNRKPLKGFKPEQPDKNEFMASLISIHKTKIKTFSK